MQKPPIRIPTLLPSDVFSPHLFPMTGTPMARSTTTGVIRIHLLKKVDMPHREIMTPANASAPARIPTLTIATARKIRGK